LVLVAAPTVELPAADLDDDEVLELEVVLDEEDDELELALPTRDFAPPLPKPPELPRLPRSCGAIRAANRSAAMIPLIRMVF